MTNYDLCIFLKEALGNGSKDLAARSSRADGPVRVYEQAGWAKRLALHKKSERILPGDGTI